MKPAWDELMEEYEGNPSILIADVDCTAAGQPLCEKVGVRGYPTIKHGDPNDLQDYEGGRGIDDLKEFAAGLGPTCSPTNLELCDDEKKSKIMEYKKMGKVALEELIAEKEKELEKVEETFKTDVEGLQAKYEELQKTKEEALKGIKEAGLGLMKSVKAAKGKAEL
jgi:hypothetical protein